MVMDVAKVGNELAVDRAEDAALEAVDRHEERVHGAIEVTHLAPEEVDPLRLRDSACEDRRFDVLDVALEAFDHWGVVVDDLVEDRPQDGDGTRLQQLGMLLEPKARA